MMSWTSVCTECVLPRRAQSYPALGSECRQASAGCGEAGVSCGKGTCRSLSYRGVGVTACPIYSSDLHLLKSGHRFEETTQPELRPWGLSDRFRMLPYSHLPSLPTVPPKSPPHQLPRKVTENPLRQSSSVNRREAYHWRSEAPFLLPTGSNHSLLLPKNS